MRCVFPGVDKSEAEVVNIAAELLPLEASKHHADGTSSRLAHRALQWEFAG